MIELIPSGARHITDHGWGSAAHNCWNRYITLRVQRIDHRPSSFITNVGNT